MFIMEYKPFIVKIPVNYILSENQRLGGGRKKHLSPQATEYKNQISGALSAINIDNFYEVYPFLNGEWNLRATYHFVINQSMYRRDLDNCIKMFQDSLFEWLELNDSIIVELHAYKFFTPSSDMEYIIATLEPSELNISAYEEKLRSVSS